MAITWQIIREIGWYNAAFDNDIPCYSFGRDNHLAVIDFFKDSVTLIDYSTGNTIRKYALNVKESPNVYYDYFNDQLYFIDQSKRNSYYYQFDSYSGELIPLEEIEGISFAQNIRFCGDWIYFLIQKPALR